MRATSIKNEIIDHLDRLPSPLQRKVLIFIHALEKTKPSGKSGASLLSFAGTIPRADLYEMTDAIEEGCEKVDPHEW